MRKINRKSYPLAGLLASLARTLAGREMSASARQADPDKRQIASASTSFL